MSEEGGPGAPDEERGVEQGQQHGQGGPLGDALESRERAFTCVHCGFSTITTSAPLQYETQSVCANCGDWTTKTADPDELIDAARDIAAEIDGPTITERQALAYLLRDVLDMERQPTADVMDSTPSNVDNLQRKAAEKLEDAERVLDGIDAVQARDEEPTA